VTVFNQPAPTPSADPAPAPVIPVSAAPPYVAPAPTPAAVEPAAATEAAEGASPAPGGITQKMSQIWQESRRVREENIRLQAQLETLQTFGLQQQAQPTQENAPEQPKAPDPREYAAGEFDPGFIRDTAKFEVHQQLAADRAAAADRQAAEVGFAAFQTTFNAAAEAGLQGATNVLRAVDRPTKDALAACENGHIVAEVLSQRRDLMQQAMSLPPVGRAAFLGRLDAQIAAELAAAQRPAAPAPGPTPTPALSGKGATPNADITTMSSGQFDAWWKTNFGEPY